MVYLMMLPPLLFASLSSAAILKCGNELDTRFGWAGLRTRAVSRFASVGDADLGLLAAYGYGGTGKVGQVASTYWRRYKSEGQASVKYDLGAADGSEPSFTLAPLAGTSIMDTDVHYRILIKVNFQPSRYEERVLRLRPGDHVTFGGGEVFELGNFLGRGAATQIYELRGAYAGFVIRIPFFSAGLLGEFSNADDKYFNQLSIARRLEIMRRYALASTSTVRSHPNGVEFSKTAPDGTYAIARRVTFDQAADDYVDSQSFHFFRPWTFRRPHFVSAGSEWMTQESFVHAMLANPAEADKFTKLVLALEANGEAIRYDYAKRDDPNTIPQEIHAPYLTTDPGKVRRLTLARKIIWKIDWTVLRQYVWDPAKAEWVLLDSDGPGHFKRDLTRRLVHHD